jgi:CheY-specific phosphatase CheX
MNASVHIENHVAEQVRIAADVFATLAAIDVEPASMHWPPREKLVSAAVHFAGSCEGAMIVECTLPLAFAFTSRLMSIPLPHSVDNDVCDAVGELVNTIGGNFKALIPGVCDMSIPLVAQGRYSNLKNPGTFKRTEVAFQSDSGDFCLILMAGDREC